MNGVALASSGTEDGDLGARTDGRLGGAGANPQGIVAPLNAFQLGDATHVDQVIEDRQAQRQHGDEALAAGQDLGSVAQVGEKGGRVRGRGRSVVFERGRLQSSALLGGGLRPAWPTIPRPPG